MALDQATTEYLGALVERLRGVLAHELVAVWLIGSGALSDYVPGASDIDVAVACEGPLETKDREATVAAVSHDALNCPARKLELVVYSRQALAAGEARFELDVNTGAGIPTTAAVEPKRGETHWYVLDLAIARERGHALDGLPPGELIAPLSPESIRTALTGALDWQERNDTEGHHAVLAACRAWRFLEEGRWYSKAEAAEWFAERAPDPGVFERALAARRGEDIAPAPAEDVRALTEMVRARLG